VVWDVKIMENGGSREIFMGTVWRLGQFTLLWHSLVSLIRRQQHGQHSTTNERSTSRQYCMCCSYTLVNRHRQLRMRLGWACCLNLCKRRADYRLHVNNTPSQAGLSFHAARGDGRSRLTEHCS